jgi:spermidine dehydrogenase
MKITRRDFVNGVLMGSGAALLKPNMAFSAASSNLNRVDNNWYGYGGVGDYSASHGNTPEVVNTAHRLRDGEFASLPANMAIDEEYDLVIIGGGMAGLGAAWHFKKNARLGQKCLMLDNHPLFGGEAKENEFEVNGETLIAPQGANGFFVPPHADDPEKVSGDARYYSEFNIPRELPYGEWSSKFKPLKFCRDNFGFLYWRTENNTSIGRFFEKGNSGEWANDIWQNELAKTPLSNEKRQALLAWYNSRTDDLNGDEKSRWLDSMSYKDYLEKELKLGSQGAAEADYFMAGAYGLGSDVISAYQARDTMMPGMLSREEFKSEMPRRNSFPGGNSGFARYFLKGIKPSAISGSDNFEDIITGAINFSELDKQGDNIRIRLNATAVSVQHEGKAENASSVHVVYSKGGKEYAVRAKGVVMASGGWVNKHVVRDLPDTFHGAYQHFHHAPFLVANVALNNWRFMYELGITGARWQDGFGYGCNIRQPMMVGRHKPALDPDKPAVLTFYVPFHSPGLPIQAQVSKGRAELFFTSYADYEKQIRAQMTKLFAVSGFDHKRDIQGIILNRWGHAYVVPTPGFFFDTKEKQAPSNVIKQGFGRIAFGHSELNGFQHWGPAADQGRRAMQQLLEIV